MYSKLIVNIFYCLAVLNPQTFIEQEEESVCKSFLYIYPFIEIQGIVFKFDGDDKESLQRDIYRKETFFPIIGILRQAVF